MTTSGGRRGRRLSGEDIELWEGVTRSVKPLRRRKLAVPPVEAKVPAPAPVPPASLKPSRRAATPVHVPTPAPSVVKAPPAVAPLEKRLKQKIARGSQTIDARLDLHGHTQADAHDVLLRFLKRAQSQGGRVVLVITGKGGRGAGGRDDRGARGEGVLKRSVPMWLALPEFRALVIGFDTAAISHGGEGALYVRVRKARE